MSRAFTKDDDNNSSNDFGERPISPHRNLVTEQGLLLIDAEIAAAHEVLAKGNAEADRDLIARASRDLRYWTARRETAEVSHPDPHSNVVRFGMTVTIVDEHDRTQTWTIVGEDEVDASHGMISHVSPMAVLMFGKSVGDAFELNSHEWEITAISAPQT
ncbi:transcription elongation factor [Phyllobacterium brassicacearum]|uniref:Transcription elongation factor n=1 Tax=Phyllobacterium brassicacearum TaxID=314235 RepID=A0A2P7BVZ1_9HYPH|nr:GreA/GreB family elongation factor [Phyllobacterium brassicacearum]PSH70602.1 transcription elongation factor [Phyllobacterium brassicacearum]TDQ35935.1 transcription elongation GreA/GreB family factor [Phyllobacterium brassicacearum]